MLTADQLRAGRALVRWSQAELAEKSGVSQATIKRLEMMEGELTGHTATIRALEASLASAGVIFIAENGEGPGVRLRKQPIGE